MNKEPDKRIIRGLLKNEGKSQELLYKQFYSYGMSVCLRYTANRNDAVEVLNDSFMKVFTKIQQYDEQYAFKAWFRRILINTAINHNRSQLNNHHDLSLDEAAEISDKQGNIINELSYDELINLVQSLSPMYRTVFNLYVIEGYSHLEISELLGISEGASKSNLSRARMNLRELLKRDHEKRLARYER
ncbi:RNA polymerase sigma factor [Echinicola marina]|uniref:RNA polymerase sigma factor n=1 Tax=Echinicola marina TaxID=2859768 RepID=UPI001CF66A31|nr:RNA polymerase sigma factor [Echinicola marina]UCS93011.1 RNA polymerase sigma factor [Echinicola marina]